jgi:hypothetical protein
VLRRIFGPRRDEVTREWKKLQNWELSALYCLKNIIRTNESVFKWAGNVARMLSREVHTGFWCENLRERDHTQEISVDKKKVKQSRYRPGAVQRVPGN